MEETEFVLDLHDQGYWMARLGKKTYPIGRDKVKAISIIQSLNGAYRPNLELRGRSVYVCWNMHEKCEGCDYEPLIENAFGD